MKPEICADCRFIKAISSSVGECRRFPPKPDGKGVHTVDEFPTVKLGLWCGEYKEGARKRKR